MSKKSYQPLIVQFDYCNRFPLKTGIIQLKWSLEKQNGVLTNLTLQKNRTIVFKTADFIEVQLNDKANKQHFRVSFEEVIDENTTKEHGKGKIDIVPHRGNDEKKKVCITMETEDKKTYDLYVMIFNKNLTTFDDVPHPLERNYTQEEFTERQFMDYGAEAPRSLEDMVEEDFGEDVTFIKYERSKGPIDLQQLFESTQSMKGDYECVDEYAKLLAKWWRSKDAYMELNSIPMLMETYEDYFWLIKVINEYKMMEFGFEDNKTTQCQLQIDYLLKDINKRVLGLIQDRIDSSLKNIIQSTVFDSSRCLYEEGVANSLANFMKYIYEGALKISPTFSDKLVRQSFHFLNYLIIEKIIQYKNVNGMKGFQLSFLAISIQAVLNQFSVLRKFIDLMSPVIEVSRLLTMPISLQMVQNKDDIFPSLSTNLIYKLLEVFKKDDVNPNKVPSDVFKWLSKHFESTPIPSRFDLIG